MELYSKSRVEDHISKVYRAIFRNDLQVLSSRDTASQFRNHGTNYYTSVDILGLTLTIANSQI